jgi:hypothetical protein
MRFRGGGGVYSGGFGISNEGTVMSGWDSTGTSNCQAFLGKTTDAGTWMSARPACLTLPGGLHTLHASL